DGIALAQRHHLRPRLLARALLGQDELAAGEIPSGRRKQDRDLQRKDMRAVYVLMQGVPVAGLVTQQERRRPGLASRMTTGEERRMIVRENGRAESLGPAIGDPRQRRIKRRAQGGDRLRQRTAIIAASARP